MRRLALGALVLVAAGCGGGGGGSSATPEDIARAASKTANTGSLEADFAVSAQGLSGSGSGIFNNKQRTGEVTMKLNANGRPIPVDSFVDGDVLYLRSPAFAQATTQDKQWIKINLATLGSSQGNTDLSGILDASPTPANALAYLQGSSTVDKVGSESVGGVDTTHYSVSANLDRAAKQASGSTKDALQGVISQSGVKTLPVDVWVDENGYIRKVSYDEHAGRRQAAKVTMELHDFGKPVPITAPPSNSVVDLTKMVGLMDVALKIWRYNPQRGERELREYEVDAPEWACLLDVLDLIKDKHDGTLAYRKSCRMMICGSCGMRMDGRAILACKEPMKPIVEAGHVPTIAPMGNMPVLKDLVVDMAPFWNKIRAMKPWLDPGYDEVAEKERIVSQQQVNAIHKEALCIMCGCCVSECNSMESDPEFLGPAALAKGFRFVGDVRDQADIARLNEYNQEHGIWDCTRCYFCNERCPKGVDPRDAIAKLGAESIKQKVDHDMGAKHAKWFVKSAETTGWLRETELVPKTQGTVEAVKQIGFALKLAKHGKVPPPFPPHVAKDVHEARALRDLVRQQGREGAAGIVQGERGLAMIEHVLEADAEHVRRQEWRRLSRSASRTTRAASPRSQRRSSTSRRRRWRRSSAWSSTSSSRSPAAAPATSTRPSPTTTCT